MPVDPLDVDLAALSLLLLECRPARVAHRARGHPGHARRGRRAGGVDCRGRVRREHDVVGAELGPGDLEDDVRDALPNLRRGAMHLGAAVGVQLDARGRVVVEPFGVADVLEPDREADAALHSFAARRVARTAR